MAVKQSSRMFRKLNHSTNVSDDFFWQKENRNMSIVQHTRRLWIQTYLSATGGHRNIAETLNVFQTPTALWSSPGISLMHRLTGSLYDLVASKQDSREVRVPLEACSNIIPQMLEGLKYLHEHKIQYPLRLDHTLYSSGWGAPLEECIIQLTGFGSAVYRSAGAPRERAISREAPWNAAPETFLGLRPSPKSDMWSAGLAFAHLLFESPVMPLSPECLQERFRGSSWVKMGIGPSMAAFPQISYMLGKRRVEPEWAGFPEEYKIQTRAAFIAAKNEGELDDEHQLERLLDFECFRLKGGIRDQPYVHLKEWKLISNLIQWEPEDRWTAADALKLLPWGGSFKDRSYQPPPPNAPVAPPAEGSIWVKDTREACFSYWKNKNAAL